MNAQLACERSKETLRSQELLISEKDDCVVPIPIQFEKAYIAL